MEARHEEAVWGALEAEPEMGILVLEIIKGGSRTGVGVAGWNGRSKPRRMWVQPPPRDSGAQGAHSQSRAWGPPETTPPWQRAIPQDGCGNCADNGSRPWGMRMSAQLSTWGQRVSSTDQLRVKRAVPCGWNMGCREGSMETLMSLEVGNYRIATWARITAPASQQVGFEAPL